MTEFVRADIRLSILVNVFDTQFFHVNNTKAETRYRLCACKVCEFEVIVLSARGREKIEKHPDFLRRKSS